MLLPIFLILNSSRWLKYLLQREIERIADAIISNKLKGLNVNNTNSTTSNDLETIWIKIYLDDKGDQLLKLLKTKLKHHFTKEVNFKIKHSTQKLRFYTNMKYQIPKLMKFDVVYHFNCPCYNDSYIRKTERNYTQDEKSMLLVMKEVPFTTILRTVVITVILKIYSVSIIIHLIKHYLVSTQSQVTLKY